jgi:hypothetical protein
MMELIKQHRINLATGTYSRYLTSIQHALQFIPWFILHRAAAALSAKVGSLFEPKRVHLAFTLFLMF